MSLWSCPWLNVLFKFWTKFHTDKAVHCTHQAPSSVITLRCRESKETATGLCWLNYRDWQSAMQLILDAHYPRIASSKLELDVCGYFVLKHRHIPHGDWGWWEATTALRRRGAAGSTAFDIDGDGGHGCTCKIVCWKTSQQQMNGEVTASSAEAHSGFPY